MNLFIDTISSNAKVILFDNNRNIIDEITWIIKWNESSTLIPEIDNLVKRNNIEYRQLDNIVVVNWPWSFTWVRTTVLAANSINYVIKRNMTALSYFDLYNNYPIIKSSSKRDCFVKLNKESEIEIIENEQLIKILNDKQIKKVYWDIKEENFENIEILEKIDYISIINNVKFDNKEQIQALYIKKPNIS